MGRASIVAAARWRPGCELVAWRRAVRTCLVALGANLHCRGDPPRITLDRAVRRMAGRGLRPLARSSLYRSSAWPDAHEPDYLNAAILVLASCAPRRMLGLMQDIERGLGRRRLSRSGPRSIDLDLLAWGRHATPSLGGWRRAARRAVRPGLRRLPLVVPHPLLHLRAFVLLPLRDLAPRWRHPALGVAVPSMLARLAAEGLDKGQVALAAEDATWLAGVPVRRWRRSP